MHFHGTVIQRPAPFYRIIKGNLFGQVEGAVDFVLSKLDASVGTRALDNCGNHTRPLLVMQGYVRRSI
jgi:hypothetical protein